MSAFAFLAVFGAAQTLPAASELPVSSSGDTWLVEIHVFSGRSNPVYELSADEAKQVQLALSFAKPSASTKATILDSRLGYRGITVTKVNAQQTATLRMKFGHGLVSFDADGVQTILQSPKIDVERYLIDLAFTKGVLNQEIYDSIVYAR